jgi:hypothetical protein
VARTGIQDAWQRSTVSLETCGTPASWKQWGYTDKNIDYNIAQALRWHASTINIKSTAIPSEWKDKFREFEKRLGYRLVLRKLEYPRVVKAGAMAPVGMWWLNAGVAPVYAEHRLALEFRSASASAVIRVPADVRKWLPGDAVVDTTAHIPPSLKPGEYKLRLALLDPRTGKPAIRLAIEGREEDGWYGVGDVRVE